MNHFDWEDSVQRWQNGLGTHEEEDSGWMEDPCGTHSPRTYYQSRDAADDPANRPNVQSGAAGQCPSTMETADPSDGIPFDSDHELTRKIKELRKLEEKIRSKKVELGCKAAAEASPAACEEELDTCTGPSLKDRVDAILQQRQSKGFLSKVRRGFLKLLPESGSFGTVSRM